MPLMRLQKFLSAAGVCSRRQGETVIRAGRVAVNGSPVTTLGAKVDPENDRITVDGVPAVLAHNLVYIALNKPEGYESTCRRGETKTVVDLIDVPERIYPVGRLDKDSTGLLLLTNDGRIHHRLSHPAFDHEKEYEVEAAKPIPEGALRKMAAGLPLMGRTTRPARVVRLSGRRFRIVLMEGRNRQIRRMVRKIGNQVTRLHRVRIAGITLGRLAPGKWRHLTGGERKALLRSAGLPESP